MGAENPDVLGFVYNQIGRGLLFAPQLFLVAAFLSFRRVSY